MNTNWNVKYLVIFLLHKIKQRFLEKSQLFINIKYMKYLILFLAKLTKNCFDYKWKI